MVCYFFLLPVCHRSGLRKDSSGVLHALLPNSPPHLVEIAALTLVFNYISMKMVKKHTKKTVVVAQGRENHRTWFWWYWSFLFSVNILSPLLYLTQLILPLWKETSCLGNVAPSPESLQSTSCLLPILIHVYSNATTPFYTQVCGDYMTVLSKHFFDQLLAIRVFWALRPNISIFEYL